MTQSQRDYLVQCKDWYRKQLTENIMPFWLEHGMDPVNGGVYTCVDREGKLMDTTKSVWFQGRCGFVFAYAYNNVEKNPEWLKASKSCIDFIENKMPARVKNRLDDVVELRQLTDTYLLLQLSERSTAEMRLFGDSLCCLINTYEGPAADSRVRFFDAMWQPVKVVLPCPSVDDFWQSVPDSLRREADAARRSLADLTLIQVQSSPDEATLTYTLQTGELAEKEKEVAQRFVQPLVFRWDGEAFIPLPTP